jgi:hypothetical protein
MSIAGVEPAANSYINHVPYKGAFQHAPVGRCGKYLAQRCWCADLQPAAGMADPHIEGRRVSFNQVSTLFCASTFPFRQREVTIGIRDLVEARLLLQVD